MDIKTIFIVGSGLMGSGIAQAAAQSGYKVILTDAQPEPLEKALKAIAWSVGKLVEKGKIKGSAEEIMARIETDQGISRAAEAELVIEAVFEDSELKAGIFTELDQAAGPEAIIASNTSAISISQLAGATSRPTRVLGLHFFSPVPMMPAAEVIRGHETAGEVFAAGVKFVEKLGKYAIKVNRDVPAFVINRINYRANLEAMRLVEEGVASVADIDEGLKKASGRKMGPFEIGDMVGLDITYGALMSMYEETKDPYWYPPAIMRRKIKAGHLGKKTGQGWYEYNEDGSRK